MWVERVKWPDHPHYGARGVLLGGDRHGRWVGLPAQHPVHRGEQVLFVGQHPAVICVSHEDWFMAHWFQGHEVELYVDIVTPPTWTARGATMVDLDFDVVVIDGEATLVDEDEFEEHRHRYAYPSTMIAGARAAAADVYERVARRRPPFTEEDGARWHLVLAELTGSSPSGTARSPRDR